MTVAPESLPFERVESELVAIQQEIADLTQKTTVRATHIQLSALWHRTNQLLATLRSPE